MGYNTTPKNFALPYRNPDYGAFGKKLPRNPEDTPESPYLVENPRHGIVGAELTVSVFLSTSRCRTVSISRRRQRDRPALNASST